MSRFAYLTTLVVSLGLPAGAYAQAAIAGMVKDPSGAVLPGVTVEAASPALLEKVRSVVTDGTGQYRIVDLRPGIYSVTFTLTGFNTVKREGIELTGSFTATVNAELRVGALEETITVTGETPVVDVQSATRQQVMTRQIIDTIPAGRSPVAFGALVPAANTPTNVGGAIINPSNALAVHGGRPQDQLLMQSGTSLGAMAFRGHASRMNVNMASVQEVAFDYSSVSAEQAMGGVRINLIPRDGGNRFAGTGYFNFANSSMQGNNLSQSLKDRGLTTPDSIKKLWDVNPGVGGPIKKDRVWFYFAPRYFGAYTNVAGMFYNRNANKSDVWSYDPDTNRPASNDSSSKDAALRIAWQVTPRLKVGIASALSSWCQCPQIISATRAPEADQWAKFPNSRKNVVDWSSPMTNRVLLEGGFVDFFEATVRDPMDGLDPRMITVTEQSNGLQYRGPDPGLRSGGNRSVHERLAISYVTGAHAFKVGVTHNHGFLTQHDFDVSPVSYRFNNGVPNQLAMRALPTDTRTNVDRNLGLFAQDRWTMDRLTFSYGVRYDYFANSFPEQHLGPAILTPTRELALPAQANLAWRDVTPKLGASYNLFGTGKTALKVSLNKYLEAVAGGNILPNDPNPIATLVTSTTRNWNDANRNYVPECDLLNPAVNGECAAMANANFGKPIPGSTFDAELVRGWGKRGFNWEFSAGVQHELLPRTSVDVSYFRRWYGNFTVADDRTVAATDFDRFSITAPVDPRLPGGGSYVISGLYNLNPAKFGQPAANFVTRADNYGRQIEHFNGVDVVLNTRPQAGVVLQGGVSTGKTTTDNCEVAAKVPEILLGMTAFGTANNNVWTPLQFCHQETTWLTQVKGFASYTIPRVDVQLSGTFQSLSGPLILANYNAPNAVVAPSLGRNLSGNAANVSIGLVAPGTIYGERLDQLDVRVGKLVRAGRTRTTFSVDLYNALNANPVTSENSSFATWRRPTGILVARFAKLNVQLDF